MDFFEVRVDTFVRDLIALHSEDQYLPPAEVSNFQVRSALCSKNKTKN